MPIDPRMVKWEEQAAPVIDPRMVKWEEEKPQPSKREQADAALGKVVGKVTNYDPTNLNAGMVRGAGSIGSTLIRPFESADANAQRRAAIDSGLTSLVGSDPNSTQYKTGKLGAEIAGTSGVGGLLGKAAAFLRAPQAVITGLQTGGLDVAGKTGLTGLATRGATGAVVGGATAGLVDPKDALTGAKIGGALPVAAKVAGTAAREAGRSITGGPVSDEVALLARRAQDRGIQVPADRIANSKPLNALAASLEYAPFSGRAATVDRMTKQMNTAVSNTVGQNTDNVTKALRTADDVLGREFDRVLSSTKVNVDQQFMNDLADSANMAAKELGADQARIIQNQIDEIIAKAGNGQIDGQAAYNIKKTLDRIGKRSTPEAHYAIDLKKSLMDALNRSLGPDEAAKFAATRQQYGNMLALEKIAKNGAEGDISIARLANMRNINNPDLQELADIAAQFMVTRESPHGALQRLVIGTAAAGAGAPLGALPVVAGGMAAGRAANGLLNSQTLKNSLLNNQAQNAGVSQGLLGISKVAPLLSGQ